MIKNQLFNVAFLPFALAVSPAYAQEEAFEGISATLVGGIDHARIAGRSDTGAVYAGQLGYDLRSNNLVFGLEGEIGDATTKVCLAALPGFPGFCSSSGRELYAGGRVGIVAGETTLLYAKAGYSSVRQTYDYGTVTPPAGARRSGTADGWRVGLGIEQVISGNFHLKAEYRYSDNGVSLSRHQGVVGLGVRF